MPDEEATDELVGDDMDAAEWAALDAPLPTEEPADARRAPDVEAAARRRRRGRVGGHGGAPRASGGRSSTRWSLAARAHEAARVRRKVVASTTGAGAAGFIPLLLQLVDALRLSPQVAATVTTAVAALGALVAGYFTPDRAPVLPPSPHSVAAPALDVAPLVPFPAPARGARCATGPPRSTGRTGHA